MIHMRLTLLRRVVLSLALFAPCVVAQGVLDQVHWEGTPYFVALQPSIKRGQSFTAGMTGTLTRIDIRMTLNNGGNSSDIDVSIVPYDPCIGQFKPPSEALGTVTVSAATVAASVPEISVDVESLGIHVSQGKQYMIVVDPASEVYLKWHHRAGYAGGQKYVFLSSSWEAGNSFDRFFRTYVLPGDFAYSATQDSSTGDATFAIMNGEPLAPYWLFHTQDTLNCASPGTGFLFGLHISFPELGAQIASGGTGNPFFGGTLDGTGGFSLSIPGSAAALLSGQTWWAVAIQQLPNGELEGSEVERLTFQ